MITQSEFLGRRQQLMQMIGPKGAVILPAAPHYTRNGDAEFPFRQQSDFYYLSGFEEPDSVMVLLPKNKNSEFILFNRVRHRAEEIWTGYRAGQEGAVKKFGAHLSFPIHEFEMKLPELLEGCEEIHYTLGINTYFDKIILNAVNKIRGKIRSGMQTSFTFVDVSHSIHEMRLIKSPAEIHLMRKSAEIAANAHVRAMEKCRPGMYEYELEAELLYEFQRHGARYPAYNAIVGSGENSCILHYNDNNQKIPDKSIVLIDAGCEYQYYASDITRTFPANGKFSGEQRAIYDIVLEAQLAGIQTISPGSPWNSTQEAMIRVITQGLKDLGLLKGSLDELIEKGAYFDFYMHKSGHWLGIDVHDVGRYKVNGNWRPLEFGMVLTVEPGIYISEDIPGIDKKWHGIGVRIEDDVFVSEKNHEVLSYKVPKKVDEIEAIMKS